MATPAWFNAATYFSNKLAAMGTGWDTLTLKNAFKNAGYDADNADDLYAHFVSYGNAENVSPNANFNVSQYLTAKAAQFYNIANPSANEVTSLLKLIEQAGLTVWDHYNLYGWKEGLNPSLSVDSNQYMADKLVQMQVTNPSYTMTQLIAAFDAAGVSPLTHYFNWGASEGLTLKPSSGQGGSTIGLTEVRDTLFGTAGNDFFAAKLGDLNDNDYVDGLGGYDVLRAEAGYSDRAIEPTFRNIEKVIIQAQHNNNDSGSNNPSLAGKQVDIDAGDIKGMTYLQNDRSRADLTVEDVRTLSNIMTLALTNTDPGDVDFNVYFDPQYLTATNPGGTLNVLLMDVRYADVTGGVSPLRTNPYDVLRFTMDGQNVELRLVDFADAADYTGVAATYTTLAKAFQDALQHAIVNGVANQDLSAQITVSLGDPFTGTGSVGGSSWSSNAGETIVLSAANNILGPVGWMATGVVPSDSAYVTTTSITGTCPLIVTNIHLDNVGRVKWDHENPDCLPADAIFGSKAGDMVVGSMATTGGVERFNMVVDEGSWLASLSSTNNTLRMIQAVNGNVDTKVADGQLFIGSSLAAAAADGNLVDWHTNLDPRNPAGNPGSWIDMPKLLSTDGLTDVKVFDGSTMDGNINIGAQITAQSYGKYNRDVDGLRTVYDNYAPNLGTGEFVYNLGKNADTLNMAVHGGIAADIDFGLHINAGAGNDLVNFRFTDLTTNQLAILRAQNIASRSSQVNQNVHIDGGAGSDTIKIWGNGAITVDGGAGNDAIYVGQNAVDQNAVFLFNVGATAMGVAPIANTMIYVDDVYGAQPLANDLLGTVRTFAYTATAGGNVNLTVNFLGELSTVRLLTNVTASGTITADAINKAIIRAINEDSVLSKLLVAKDGAGNSLIVESLVDGAMVANDLTVNIAGSGWTSTAADAAYERTVMASGATDLLDVNVTLLDPFTASVNMGTTAMPWAPGDILQIKIGDEIYTVESIGAASDEWSLISELFFAADKNGVLLDDRYSITSGSLPFDGVFNIVSRFGEIATNIDISRMPAAGLNVTGTDDGTTSHNIVRGGAGDDVLVLNVASSTQYNDTVILHTGMGNDYIYGFETGFDDFAIGSLVSTTSVAGVVDGALVGLPTGATAHTVAQAAAAGLSITANQTGVVWLHDTAATANVVTFFQVVNDGTAAVSSADNITVLGTVTLEAGATIATATDFVM